MAKSKPRNGNATKTATAKSTGKKVSSAGAGQGSKNSAGGSKNKPAPKTRAKKNIFKRKLSNTERRVWGIIMLFVAIYLLVAIVSYYFTWSADQEAILQGGGLAEAWDIHNHAGKFGALLADILVGRWFGVFAFCIPVVLIILGLRAMRIKPVFLDKSVRAAFITMILGSVTLGYLFGTHGGMFGSGPGGEAGIAVAAWLAGFLGPLGMGVILLMCWFVLIVCILRDRVSAVDAWFKSLFPKREKKEKPDRKALRAARREEKARLEEEGAAALTAAGEEARLSDSAPWDDIEEYAKETDFSVGDVEIVRSEEEEFVEITAEREDPGSDMFVVLSGSEEDKPTETVPTELRHGTEAVATDDFEVIDIRGDRVMASSLRDGEKPVRRIKAVNETSADDNIEILTAGNISTDTQETNKQENTPETAESSDEVLGTGGVVLTTGDEDMEILLKERRDAEAEEEDLLFRDPTRKLPRYQKPPWQILADHKVGVEISREEIQENQRVIRSKLEDFGIRITDTIKATVGPTVTLYEIEPAQGVKVSKIRGLEEDIALALKVQGIRIVTLGQGRGTIGIEVPNSKREIVSMLSIINTRKFQDCNFRLPIALGRTIYNELYIGDLTKMPHLLVAGATGQGKSVGLNAIITSLLYKKHPAELKFVLVDPKQVELSLYAKLENHFLACMESEDSAIITDTQKAVNTLNSLVQVMEERYTLLNRAGERNIADYNEKLQRGELKMRDGHKFMPYIVVIIDEFADMIMTAGREAEIPITRLAAKARAVGIHLIVATQRPDVKVITGLIKSNIPARIAFKVVSMVDSRTIIDQPGANNLIGMGDMLMYLNGELTRIQCAFIDTPEIDSVTAFIAKQQGFEKPYQLPHYSPPDPRGDKALDKEDVGKFDPMFAEIARFVVSKDQGSTSAIQRNFELGYNRAGRITDQLERAGIVGRANGSKPREVLVKDLSTLEIILMDLGM